MFLADAAGFLQEPDCLFHWRRWPPVSDKGLVTNYGEGGGYKTGGGGHVKFYPYEKGGAEKVLAMLKGGHKKFWGSFYAVA